MTVDNRARGRPTPDANTSVHDLFKTRLASALISMGCLTLGDVAGKSERELRGAQDIGAGSFDRIRVCISIADLHLAPSIPPMLDLKVERYLETKRRQAERESERQSLIAMDNRSRGRPMGPPKTLRELRLWHWRLVVSNRQNARDLEAGGRISRAKAFHGKADWHLSAVQVLNEHFDVVAGDTAERDDQK